MISIRTVRIAYRQCTVLEASPDKSHATSLEAFIRLLMDAVDAGKICLIIGRLSEYADSDEDKNFLERDSVARHALAASIPQSIVGDLSDSTIRALVGTDFTCGLIVFPRSIGLWALRLTGRPYPASREVAQEISIAEIQTFNHLWSRPVTMDYLQNAIQEAPRRALLIHGIGEVMAEMHRRRIRYRDAHIGNFGSEPRTGKVYAIDEGGFSVLLRDPTSCERASDIACLLPSFSPDDWCYFKLGYLEESGWRGELVVRQIEDGSEFKSLEYFESGQYDKALSAFLEELKDREDEGESDLAAVLNNIALCHARLGQPDAAREALERAESCLTPDKDELGRITTLHNIAANYYRIGIYDEAVPRFEAIRLTLRAGPNDARNLHLSTLSWLSRCYWDTARPREALGIMDELIDYARKLHDSRLEILEQRRKEMARLQGG